jgi:hypothetical protein
MSVLEFIAAMTTALAWPVFLGAVVLAFRQQLGWWLADRPSRMKVGPFEAEWDAEQARVEVALDEATATTSAGVADSALSERLDHLADSAPLEAIAQASQAITGALLRLLEKAGVRVEGSHGMAGLAALASEQGLIRKESARAVHGLSVMRGLAMRGGRSIGPGEAREFLALAEANLFAIGAPS